MAFFLIFKVVTESLTLTCFPLQFPPYRFELQCPYLNAEPSSSVESRQIAHHIGADIIDTRTQLLNRLMLEGSGEHEPVYTCIY